MTKQDQLTALKVAIEQLKAGNNPNQVAADLARLVKDMGGK